VGGVSGAQGLDITLPEEIFGALRTVFTKGTHMDTQNQKSNREIKIHPEQKWFDLGQAAAYTGRTYETIRMKVRRGKIKASKPDRKWAINRAELDRFLAGSTLPLHEVIRRYTEEERVSPAAAAELWKFCKWMRETGFAE
jgi:excisionase family DNA binding protein